jgi:hypothetical protein
MFSMLYNHHPCLFPECFHCLRVFDYCLYLKSAFESCLSVPWNSPWGCPLLFWVPSLLSTCQERAT